MKVSVWFRWAAIAAMLPAILATAQSSNTGANSGGTPKVRAEAQSGAAQTKARQAATAATPQYPFLDQSLSTQQRVDDLVGRLTLEEKSRQLVNTAPAVPRLGIPAYDYWSEGLHGIARSGYATLFPQAIGNAATFDAPLLGKIGETVSTEARAKYNDAVAHDIHSIYFGLTIWSPNINIFRDPRWGRGQETYGEDPFLTATLGTAFVKGIQGDNPAYYRAIATPKHYAVHSGPESTRHNANVDVSPHDLWDTYLPAFRKTIVEGKADSIMCAYNRIDGSPACASKLLLTDTLRRDWKFNGFVTSDCGAIDDFYSKDGHHFAKTREEAAADGVRSGTDTNCGDTYLALPQAVRQKLLSEAEIDTVLKRLFTARMKLGLFDAPATMPWSRVPMNEVMSPAHGRLALQAARESMVLLKNDHGTLPMSLGKPGAPKRIAVVGPGADDLLGIVGNYYTIPKDPQLPVDAIAKAGAQVIYAQGAPYAAGLKMTVPRTYLHAAPVQTRVPTRIGIPLQAGLTGQYFANEHFEGTPAVTRLDKEIQFDWTAAKPADAVPANAFSVRWTGSLTAPAPGDYTYTARLGDCYPCKDYESVRITVDGDEKLKFTSDTETAEGRGSTTKDFKLHFADASPHAIVIEYAHRAELFGAGLTFQWTPPANLLREAAVAAAKNADAVIAFAGLNASLEGEEMPIHVPGFSGGDRTDIALPAAQQQMLEALKAAVKGTDKPLIVVLMNGSALAVNWAQQNADAVLEAWYPGQAGAQAIAETLTGVNNPGGRLPVTFYSNVNDLPAFTDYSMANRTYRYYKGKPLYGFGYGLSYTTFTYSNVKVSSANLNAGQTLRVEADVKNTGKRAGDEVAELYLTPPQDGTAPICSLEGFERLHLQPGQSRHVTFILDPRQLSQVDTQGTRAVRPGSYKVTVGGGQPVPTDTTAVSFTIAGTQELPH